VGVMDSSSSASAWAIGDPSRGESCVCGGR
jgi:hypothetical protein